MSICSSCTNPLVAADADDRMAIEIALNEVCRRCRAMVKAGKTRFIGFRRRRRAPALLKAVESQSFRHEMQVGLQRAPIPVRAGRCERFAGQDYGRVLERTQANDMGTIVILRWRAALAGTGRPPSAGHCRSCRDRLRLPTSPETWPRQDRSSRWCPTRLVEPRGDGAALRDLQSQLTTMLVGYSTLDQLIRRSAAVPRARCRRRF